MDQLIESKRLQLSVDAIQLEAVANLQQITTNLANTKTTVNHSDHKKMLLKLPQILLMEVATHDSIADCWIVIYDRVYNVTEFIENHPGGRDVILEYAGRDASLAFRGTGHSINALRMLKKFEIGELPHAERIFRCAGKLDVCDLPL